MKCKHHLKVSATCPVDESVDVYDVTVTTRRLIKVEEILAAVERARRNGAIFQEEFTTNLSLALTAKVTTIGVHSGVKTKVVCKS